MLLKIKNIINNISYFEFLNKISSLIRQLLYSNEQGYIFLKSKDAILNFENVLKKYDYEAFKLAKDVQSFDVNSVIEYRKKDLLAVLEHHYNEQLQVWAKDVFDDLIDNILFDYSVNKNNITDSYKKIIVAVNWLANMLSFDNDSYAKLKDETINRLENLSNSYGNADFVKSKNKDTNPDVFMNIWKMLLNDSDEFIQMNLNDDSIGLSVDDIKYLEYLQKCFASINKTSILDEINLIMSAVDIAKLKNNSDIYTFIKQINSDFLSFVGKNQKISEEDKIKLVSRRISLFNDKNNSSKEYFKNLIISSNV